MPIILMLIVDNGNFSTDTVANVIVQQSKRCLPITLAAMPLEAVYLTRSYLTGALSRCHRSTWLKSSLIRTLSRCHRSIC